MRKKLKRNGSTCRQHGAFWKKILKRYVAHLVKLEIDATGKIRHQPGGRADLREQQIQANRMTTGFLGSRPDFYKYELCNDEFGYRGFLVQRNVCSQLPQGKRDQKRLARQARVLKSSKPTTATAQDPVPVTRRLRRKTQQPEVQTHVESAAAAPQAPVTRRLTKKTQPPNPRDRARQYADK